MSILENRFLGKCPFGKCQFWKIGFQENVHLAKCTFWKVYVQGNVYSGKCTFREMYIQDNVYSVKCFSGNVLSGRCFWGRCTGSLLMPFSTMHFTCHFLYFATQCKCSGWCFKFFQFLLLLLGPIITLCCDIPVIFTTGSLLDWFEYFCLFVCMLVPVLSFFLISVLMFFLKFTLRLSLKAFVLLLS